MREKLAKELRRPGICIKALAAKAGVALRTLYLAREGKSVSLDTFAKVLPFLRPESQSRVLAEAGLLVQPMTSEGYSLGEAAAGVAAWNSDYVEALSDNRIDHRERRKLMERAHDVLQAIGGWLRKERSNES